VQAVGEGMRSERPVRISFGNTFSISLDAALWRHDPERRDLMEGGLLLKERLVFSVRKAAQPTAFEEGTLIRCDITGGKAFIVETVMQVTTDHIAWKYEARRAPGSDA
jgi:hypothetical protein